MTRHMPEKPKQANGAKPKQRRKLVVPKLPEKTKKLTLKGLWAGLRSTSLEKPVYTFDTSVIIAYRVRELPQNFLLSAAVIAELTAGATDDSTRKVFEAMRRDYAGFQQPRGDSRIQINPRCLRHNEQLS